MAQLWRLKWHICGASTHSIWVTTQFSYVYLHICSIYILSMGKTWSDLLKLCAASSSSSPLSNQMDPVVSLTYRSIFPPSPTETQLKCSPPHLYKYDSWLRILGSDKGSPGLCPPLPRRLPPPPPAAYIALHCTVTPTCIASKPRHLGSTPYCTVLGSPNSRNATQ